jgi:hypothetical protein
MASYLQRTALDKGYLVTKRVWMGKKQTIALPAPIDPYAADATDQKIIRDKVVKAITKRKAKLDSALKKGYTMVWNQCSQEV